MGHPLNSLGDGGPAFPRLDGMEPSDNGRFHCHVTGGMSLRDYFAAKALQGYIVGGVSRFNPNAVIDAYRYADAMIMVRAEGGAA